MQRVSSQLTIFLRIFIPTVWFTFIGSVVVLLVWAVRGKAGLLGNPFIWVGLLLILGCGYAVIHFFLWRLYRVDMDDQYVYISNYFKTYRYNFDDIDTITDSKTLPGRVFCIHLKAKGSLGQSIYFLASQVLWKDYLMSHDKVREKTFQEKKLPDNGAQV